MHTGRGGQSAARAGVAFVFILLSFGYLRNKPSIQAISDEVNDVRISPLFLALHGCLMLAFLAYSLPAAGNPASVVSTLAWYGSGLGAIVFASFAFVQPRIWKKLFEAVRNVWIYALAAALIAWSSVRLSWALWNLSSLKFIANITFSLVELLLRPLLPEMVSNRSALIIGSPAFNVVIGDACSGLEGIGLIVVFGIVWLLLFRRECRFPRSLLIIPAGVVIVFLLNAVRIAALILIGNAGAPAVAFGGFHSQAGWIGFNLVALGCSFAVPRISWFSARETTWRGRTEANPAVPWLLPFVFILAAGMISRATSSGFEWFYPLRVAAAVLAFWMCRRSVAYRNLIREPGWESLVAGTFVFVLWIALDHAAPAQNGIAAGLASLSPSERALWIVFRVLGAIVTVPLAEELAFRGFLLRRLTSRDFETVDFRRPHVPALIVSSLAFGLMHGDRWVAGAIAGLIYALAAVRTGKLCSAVYAHAITNAMIAAWVLSGEHWQLW